MAKVMKILTTIRTHWKKSAFAAGGVAYGVSYLQEKYEINQLMRTYCEEASRYGNIPQPVYAKSKNILVIVNPIADRRSSLKNFEQYCAPILHVAGLAIEIVKTDSEGHARRYIEELEKLPDAILIAGGDGTICEAITGLLRRSEYAATCPIGIIPVGRTNTAAGHLFGQQKESKLKDIESMAKASMSIVRGKIEPKDVMKIEILPHQTEEGILSSKPIYAIGALHWGAYRDALNRRDKYWYFGSLRDYATFLFNAFDSKLTWNCTSKLLYTDPCPGCSNCFQKRSNIKTETRRWWSMFIPRFKPTANQINEPDLSKNKNDNCTVQTELNVNPSEIIVENNTMRSMDDLPKLTIKFGPAELTSFDFISNSWTRIRHPNEEDQQIVDKIDARMVDLVPENVSTEEKEVFYSIDNESFEVKPIRISVVPKAIQVYTM